MSIGQEFLSRTQAIPTQPKGCELLPLVSCAVHRPTQGGTKQSTAATAHPAWSFVLAAILHHIGGSTVRTGEIVWTSFPRHLTHLLSPLRHKSLFNGVTAAFSMAMGDVVCIHKLFQLQLLHNTHQVDILPQGKVALTLCRLIVEIVLTTLPCFDGQFALRCHTLTK